MQIYEAALQALQEIGRPAHLRDIHRHVVEKGYFEFGAADPIRVLGVQIDRHSRGVPISKPASPELFYRASPATYGLLQWLDSGAASDVALDAEIGKSAEVEALDVSLFLEQELQRWLFRNWEQSRLVALEFGPLELFDSEQQCSVLRNPGLSPSPQPTLFDLDWRDGAARNVVRGGQDIGRCSFATVGGCHTDRGQERSTYASHGSGHPELGATPGAAR